MDTPNTNNQPPNPISSETVAQPSVGQAVSSNEVIDSAFQQDVKKVRNLIQKIKDGIKQKREMAKNTSKDESAQGGKKGMSKNKLLIMIALGVFVFFAVLLVAASIYSSIGGKRRNSVTLPTPTPEAVETATPSALFKPSRYATDAGVLEIEALVNELDKNMGSVDIRESQLTPPSLDFEVVFKK